MNKKLIFFAALSLCQLYAVSSDTQDQSNSNTSPTEQYTTNQSTEELCGKTPRPYRVEMRHVESKGIGYNKGYSTIEGFFTLPQTLETSLVPFLDLRAHVFNDGEPAVTAGAGLRFIKSRTWGFNTYYDYRKTDHFHYNQVGLGFETLGERWDYRINGYLPVGKKKSHFYQTRFDKFEDHYLKLVRKREFALKGVNAEAGAHFYEQKNFNFYAAAGPYWLEGEGKVAWGGQARVMMNALDYLRVQLSGSYDTIYRTVVQGELSLIVPFGGRKKVKSKQGRTCSSQMTMAHRALQRVDRFEIIPVDHKKHRTTAINPVTGAPYYFIFVDNTSHSLGTFESPYTTIDTAMAVSNPNDIIYIFPGSGPYNLLNTITPQNGQQFLGAGNDYLFATQWGKVNVKHQATGLPTIFSTVPGVDSVLMLVLNNNNVVSGLSFVQTVPFATGSENYGAIWIAGGNNCRISGNIFTVAPGEGVGVSINDAPATGTVISNNIFVGPASTLGAGVFSANSGGSLVINNNLFTGANSSSGLSIGIDIKTESSDLSVSISDNVFNSQFNTSPAGSNAPTAMALFANTHANINATITGNQVTLPPGLINQIAGIYLSKETGAGVLSATLENNSSFSTNTPPSPGYFFENTSVLPTAGTLLQIDFRSSNVGTVSYNIP